MCCAYSRKFIRIEIRIDSVSRYGETFYEIIFALRWVSNTLVLMSPVILYCSFCVLLDMRNKKGDNEDMKGGMLTRGGDKVLYETEAGKVFCV